MNNINSVLLEGYLTSDPELAWKPKGFPICTFELGCTRYQKDGKEMLKEVSFFEIQVSGKMGELCAEKLKAHRGVRVVGRLKAEQWTDDRGDRHYRVYVVAEHVEFKPKEELEVAYPVVTEGNEL